MKQLPRPLASPSSLRQPEAIMFSMVTAWTVNMIFSIAVYKTGKWKKKGIINSKKDGE